MSPRPRRRAPSRNETRHPLLLERLEDRVGIGTMLTYLVGFAPLGILGEPRTGPGWPSGSDRPARRAPRAEEPPLLSLLPGREDGDRVKPRPSRQTTDRAALAQDHFQVRDAAPGPFQGEAPDLQTDLFAGLNAWSPFGAGTPKSGSASLHPPGPNADLPGPTRFPVAPAGGTASGGGSVAPSPSGGGSVAVAGEAGELARLASLSAPASQTVTPPAPASSEEVPVASGPVSPEVVAAPAEAVTPAVEVPSDSGPVPVPVGQDPVDVTPTGPAVEAAPGPLEEGDLPEAPVVTTTVQPQKMAGDETLPTLLPDPVPTEATASTVTLSAPDEPEEPSDVDLSPTISLGFHDGLEGWTIDIVGGSEEGRGSVRVGSAILREGDSFLVSLERGFVVPANSGPLVFRYTELSFDTTDPDSINDAFEASVLDADGHTLVSTFAPGRDAFFNITEDVGLALGPGASEEGDAIKTVTLDLSGVQPGTPATVRFRLVNNDQDTETTVRILDVLVPGADEPPEATLALEEDTAPEGPAGDPYRSDGLTNNPAVVGTATDDQGVSLLEARVDGGPFQDITGALADGAFRFDPGTLAPGPHTITVRVTDTAGQTREASLDFRMNAPPTADAGGDRNVAEGATVGFDGSGSTDAEDALFAYQWTFDDGSTAEGPTASRAYPQDGVYPVSLAVTDTAGSVATDTVEVRVDNLPPAVDPVSDLSSAEGEQVTLAATFSDPGVLDTHTAVVFWGDGTSSQATVDEAGGQGTVTASHTYADDGEYPIRVEVTDDAGDTGSAEATAHVSNVAPVVDPFADLSSAEGEEVALTATFSDVGVLDTHTAVVFWGDGTSSPAGVDETGGQGTATASHTYLDDGEYTVRVVVTDNAGDSGSAEATARVSNVAPVIDPVADLSSEEGASVTFTATFSDAGVLDTHTAVVSWGDGTSSQGTVDEAGGLGSVTASHIYADNGEYVVRVVVTDNAGDSDSGEATAVVTNVAPTLLAGVGFEPDADHQHLEVVLSGHFTDPGFDRPAAGTTETFSVRIDWGDGAAEDVPADVTQGSEGVLTFGSFAARHTYAAGGIYTVTVTVTDDDGGSDAESFTYGVVRIDVVPSINLRSNGLIPVKVFSDPTFDASRIDVDSLRFGPGGAPDAHGELHGGPGGFVMTHYETRAARIRPWDEVAFLTGRLDDGTPWVGLDTIRIVPKAKGDPPPTSPPAATRFYVVDAGADTAFRYGTDGSETGSFLLDVAAADPRGVTSNAAGDTVWVIDGATHQMAVQGPDGSQRGSWLALGLQSPVGVATDGSDLWVVDAGRGEVLRYVGAAGRTGGVGLPSAAFSLAGDNASPTGLATDGSVLWVTDDGRDEVFVYDVGGELLGRWGLDPENADASGITNDPTGGSDLWVVDRADRLVYHYADATARIAGDATAADTFALATGNAAPEGIADPLVTDPDDPRSWLGATVGTFASLFFGSNTPQTRQQVVDNQLLDDGRFDVSNTFPTTLLPTPWALGSGGSSSHRAGDLRGQSLDTTGTGSFGYRGRNDLDVFTTANGVDDLWFQTSNAIGDTVFDLGIPASKVAVFNTIDHGPLPQEAIESTIYLSNDRQNWTRGVVERVWLEGFHENLGIQWDGFVFVVGTGTDTTFRYVSIIWGGPGALISDGDDELNGVLGVGDDFNPVTPEDPTIRIVSPEDGSAIDAGETVLVTGKAQADARIASVALVTVDGQPVEGLDPAGNFFTRVTIAPGQNIFEFTVTDSLGQTADSTLTLEGAQTPPGEIDFALFSDVSASFQAEYGRTSFHEDADVLYADFGVRNAGQYPADTPLLVAVTNISDPTVRVRDADGLTPDGLPYYDVTALVAGGTLAAGQLSGTRELAFYNPGRGQFTYDLVFLAKLNRAPAITTVPDVEALAGRSYAYDVDALDPDGDPVTFSLPAGPAGMAIDPATGVITWAPGAADRGTHAVIVRAEDGRGGSAEQHYALSVIEPPPNRPPYFTSVPVVEANVNTPYAYDADATDPDGDPLTFAVVAGPVGLAIAADTGLVSWTPTAGQVGTHEVTLRVSDGQGGMAEQTYVISVAREPGNHPPVIVSEPVTTVVAPSCVVSSSDLVGWWPGDGNPYDIMNGNHGSLQNGTTYTSGKVSQAFRFDGDEDGVVIPDCPNIDLTADLAIEAWIKPDSPTRGVFLAKGDGDDYVNAYQLRYGGADDQTLLLAIADGASGQQASYYQSDPGVIPVGVFTHVAATIQGTSAHLYVNGVEVAGHYLHGRAVPGGEEIEPATSLTPNRFSDGGALRFGRREDSFAPFAGVVDEVKIFRRALSPEEIRADYDAGIAGIRPPDVIPSMLGLYNYDVDAIDPDNDPLTYSLTEGPLGMTIDPDSGVVAWPVSPADPTLPTVNGFHVETYAEFPDPDDPTFDPIELAFDPAGDLYVGRDPAGSQSGTRGDEAVFVRRVGPGGSPIGDYGNSPIPDPDTVAFDATGVFSGVAGSVLVGGVSPNFRGGQISAIRPDGTVEVIYGPSPAFANVESMSLNPDGRLVFVDPTGPDFKVFALQGGVLTFLFSAPMHSPFIAVDAANRIYSPRVVGDTFNIEIHAADGTLIDPAFVMGLPVPMTQPDGSGTDILLAIGPGGVWGTDLYVLSGGVLRRFDSAGQETVLGSDFDPAAYDLEFGPDGGLYVSLWREDRILRILPEQVPVTVRVEDGRGGSDEQSFLIHPPGRIEGTKFFDINNNGIRDRYNPDPGSGNGNSTPTVQLTAISTPFNSPIGIDYHEPTNTVVVSVNYPTGQPRNFERINLDGTHVSFSDFSGLTEEVKIATVHSGNRGGFTVGDLFVGNGTDGQIARITNGGNTLINPWVDLPGGGNGLLRGSLYIDRTGVFGGDLIAVTTGGEVWRITSAGIPTKLADVNTHLEGVSTVPNDPARYGPLAGKIIAGAEEQGRIYAVDVNGAVTFFSVGVNVEDIDLVPSNGNFFGVNFGTGRILGAPASAFASMVGDILLTQESHTGSGLFRLFWDGSALRAEQLPLAAGSAPIGQWEHVTFAAAGISQIPPLPMEPTLDDFVIYLDDNNNGLRDEGERFTKTDTDGRYSFTNLPPGTYIVREEPRTGWTQTAPPGGFHEVILTSGQVVTGIDFGNTTTTSTLGEIRGTKFDDLDGDSERDSGLEPGLADWVIYFDDNGNGQRDTSERFTTTDADGNYAFTNLAPGTYVVAEEQQPGWEQATPIEGTYEVTIPGEPTVADVSADFSATSNPTGDWSYGFTSTLGGSLHLFDNPYQYRGFHFWNALEGSGNTNFQSPWILHNPTNAPKRLNPYFEVPPDGIVVAPGPFPNYTGEVYVSARWTAPTTGTYSVAVTFSDPGLPGIQASEDVYVLCNGSPIFTAFLGLNGFGTIANMEPVTLFLLQGDTIDFAVGNGTGTGGDDHAVINASVTQLPIVTGVDFGNRQTDEQPPPPVNRPPVFTTTAPTSATVGQLLRYDARASDPDGDPLTFDLVVRPDGMAVQSATGTLVWVPTADQVGSHDVILRVRDGRGGVALQSFQVLVGRANTGPVITSVPTGPAVVGLLYQYQVRAQDADGDPITFSLAAGPAGMAIDPVTGLLTWTPAADQVGSQHVAVTADDGLGASTTQSFDLPVVATAPNDPPAITSTPRTSIRQGDRYLYAVAASDPNGDPLTFSLTAAPAGMTIDGAGLVTWDPAPDQFGPNAVTVRVEDGRGGFATQSFTVNVVAQGSNRPPSITSTPPQAATVGREYVYDAVASDPDGDPLAWSLDVSPAGMSIDPTAGTIRWTPTADQVGLQDLVVRVVDGQGGFATQSYAVAVRSVNLPPMITSAPVTRAAVGEGYAYAVRATDPDGDPLSFTLTAAPAGMTIDGAGLILWTPDVGQVGPHDVAVRVEDGQGGVATQTYTVEVSATAANEPPVITSTPPFSATAGVLYTYQVTAEDPDGDPVLFSLLAGPEGMSLDPTTGLLTWTPTLAQVGFQDVVVAAIDPSGAGGTQSFTVAVSDGNNAPTITSSPVQVVTAGLPYRYDVRASDPDGDPITYTLDAGPAGLAIDAFGRVTWSPGVADVGVHRVEITVADDRGAFVTQAYDLAVLADGQTPRVSLFVSANPAQLGTPVTFAVSATDNVGVETLGLTIDGNPVPLDGQGRITLLAEPVGEYAIVASATDAAGNTGLASTTLLVIDTSDTQAPVVEITAPAADAVLTAPTDVTGTASDDNLLYYTLSVAPVAGGDFVEVFRGDTSVTDGVLGLLDTSTLANDAYILRLSATDAGGNTSFIDTTINVAGDLKVGNFTLSFTDLTVPVSGIPITVSRTYDSLNAGTANELGYGWRLEFRDTDLRTGLLPSGAEQLGIYTPFRDGVHVYVTLPGGRREGFTFQAVPVSGFAGSFGFYNPTFVADAGVTSRLSVPNFTLVRNEFGEYYGVVAGGSLAYNPADTLNFGGVYFLTTREGIAYEIDANTGDLRTVRDSNGNVLTFTDDAITSNRGPQVTFERDPQGRIVAAIDPAGDRVRYAYDAAGDLVSVTDREDNVTTFVYDQPGRPHYLTEVIDPLGRTGVRTEYDDAGRLVTLIDADGHAVSLAHDPDNSVETVTDALGNTTTFEYDARGNVVTEVDALGGITRRTYDGANNMLTETDPLGHTTTFTYDGSGNVLTETDPLGHTTTFTYRAFVPGLFASVQGARTTTRLATTTDPLGNTTTNAYDGAGNLLSTTDALGNTTRFTYDDRGNQTSITDALDNVTTFEYDGAGNLTRQVDPLLHETTFTYDGNGNQLTETTTLTTPAGVVDVVTTTTYDGNGRPLTVTDAEDNTTRTEYDALGNQQATVDALGRRTEFTYDDRGQLTTILFADGTTTGIGYDELGRRTSTTDRAGRVTRFEYDPLGRLVKTIFPDDTPDDPDDNPFTRTEYDDAGRVTAQFDELGHATRFEYDDAGRQVVVRDALGNETVTTYDDAGRVTASTDALGRTTTFVVDALGRTTDTLFVDGTTMGTVYDDLGRVVSQTDQASRTTRFEYDDAGRLTAVVDPLDQRTEYGYDEAGDLTSQTDANDHTTTFEYDRVGRRTATVLPLGQRATTAYDPAGNVASTTDFNGATITFDYDDNNRLLFQHFEDGSTVGFTYTPTGQRETVTDGRGVTFYAYDERDRLASRTDPDGTAISYTYDDAGRRTSVTTPAGTTGYTFDLLGRQETVTDPADGVTRYSYDAVGNLVRTERPDGSVETRDYDDLGRLTFLEDRDGSGDVISSYDYTLSPTGRRDAVVEADGRRVDYEYDPLDRLMREAISDAVFGDRTFDYTYDPVGNRLTRLDSLEGLTAYTYDDNDRLLTETTGGVETAYGYDANGNTLSKVTGADRVSYTWDDQNRLVAADTDGDGSDDVQYQYDADGLRVAEVAGGEETRFLVDTNLPFAQVLLEYRPSGLVVASYVHGLDLIAQTRGGATSFYHVDGLGSTRALTDAAGAVTDTYAYEAFGRTVGQTGATPNVYLFAGEQRDFNVGLDYLRARYLDTGTGRFYGMDPFQGFQQQPMSLHRFLYANTNPANNIDPSGKIGIVAAIAASILQAELSLISQTAFGGLRIRVAEDFAGNLLKPAFEARDESLLRIADGTGGKVAFAVFTTSTTIISQGFVLFALGLKRISAAESKVNLGLSFLTINPTIKDLGEHILDQITPTPSSVAGSLAALAFDNLISALDQSFTLTDVMRRIDTTSSALDNLIAIEVDQGIINSLILTKKSLTALGNLAKIAN